MVNHLVVQLNQIIHLSLDIQPKIDEYRIVGSTGISVGISSIRAGDGATPTTTITVTTSSAVTGLDVDTPFRIENVNSDYNGDFVVTEKVSSTQIKYTFKMLPLMHYQLYLVHLWLWYLIPSPLHLHISSISL